MKKEARNGVENVTDARWRTSQATGVSQKTVTRILKEKKTSEETGSPMRSPHRNKKPRKCIKRNMKEADVEVIKHTISNYQSQYNKPPTLYDLKKLLKESIHFVGCIETLRSVLFEIGYEFIPTKNHSSRHKKLVEKRN
ncbi:Uncharacterized protein OBRU01_21011 [Operophtera brumata]|uniref:Uncharacterized protein n=1 Tax=Operophtera brumata TaxID=104452 RepID=A0A0L7KU49_OPEBR|nr:Uncharacterized protein OBRU01_21011 [Operophtera brumata]